MALELNGVSKRYRRGAVGADSVNLSIRPGEVVALLGPSGSGKSTLLQIMGLLLPPDEGAVHLDGKRVDELPERAAAALRRSRIGFVFQSFGLLPLLSAEENVGVALRLLGSERRSAREQVAKALAVVGLEGRAHHRPDELSGGEQQRVALARAMVHSPDYLLADEPTGELDSATGSSILEQLALVAAQGAAVVIASHDPRVLAVADKALFVRDGGLHTPDRADLEVWVSEGIGPLSSRPLPPGEGEVG